MKIKIEIPKKNPRVSVNTEVTEEDAVRVSKKMLNWIAAKIPISIKVGEDEPEKPSEPESHS